MQALGRKKRDRQRVRQRQAEVLKTRQNLDKIENHGLLGYTVNQSETIQNMEEQVRQAAAARES